MTKPRRYFVAADSYVHGMREYRVIDRQTGKAVFTSIFESRAIKQRNKLNGYETAIPGGFNKRMKS